MTNAVIPITKAGDWRTFIDVIAVGSYVIAGLPLVFIAFQDLGLINKKLEHEKRLNGYVLTGISRFAGATVFIFVDLYAFVIANLIQTYIAFKGYSNNKKLSNSK